MNLTAGSNYEQGVQTGLPPGNEPTEHDLTPAWTGLSLVLVESGILFFFF